MKLPVSIPLPAARPVVLRRRQGFSLVEVLLVISLLALIVLALMDVFSSTQRAFRASVTQSDVMESSRAAMELMTEDLRKMTPCYGKVDGTNVNFFSYYNGLLFGDAYYAPLVQSLPGTTTERTNLLNYIYILGRQNNQWIATAYIVVNTNTSPLYPLYRYHAQISTTFPPGILSSNFLALANNQAWTNAAFSHLMDGVVHLVARPYDPNGTWMTNGYNPYMMPPAGAYFVAPAYGEANCAFYSNALPAMVEIQLGVIEDRALAKAEGLNGASTYMASNYLSSQSGALHLFRQQVSIPNLDRSAYQ
ncbi:MAG TPA: prepilin-type N-terminal cleavage/methylation domain-containing protein [Verrucomicrobiae bacterium]